MKKFVTLCLATALTLTLISWGFKGHRITALIAENHLTPQAKAGIKQLLGHQSLADVSTWADEIKSDPEYKSTASWHFLNLPLGLNYDQFSKAVLSQQNRNVYNALLASEQVLALTSNPVDKRVAALKFIVHLIGDAHQPMHISRAEDKGGNTIQVQFTGRGTNLHSLWDSGLIDHENLSESQLVSKLEAQVKPNDVQKYQSAEPLKWLYESYSISSTFYEEVAKNNVLDESYYTSHVDVLNQRLIAGGLRLAGVLNSIFKATDEGSVKTNPKAVIIHMNDRDFPPPSTTIDINDAANHIGAMVTVAAKAYSAKDMDSMILVNLGAAYPNQLLTVVLRGEAKDKGTGIDGKTVIVTGKLIDYKGKPEIVITDPAQFKITP